MAGKYEDFMGGQIQVAEDLQEGKLLISVATGDSTVESFTHVSINVKWATDKEGIQYLEENPQIIIN